VYDGPLVTLLSDVRSALEKVRSSPANSFVVSPARPLGFNPAPLEELRHQIAQLTLQLQSTVHELHTERDRSAEDRRQTLEARQQITTLESGTASQNKIVDVLEAKLRAMSENLVIFDDVRSRLTEATADRDELLLLVAELDELRSAEDGPVAP
jgi:chromosome segregation ATPase